MIRSRLWLTSLLGLCLMVSGTSCRMFCNLMCGRRNHCCEDACTTNVSYSAPIAESTVILPDQHVMESGPMIIDHGLPAYEPPHKLVPVPKRSMTPSPPPRANYPAEDVPELVPVPIDEPKRVPEQLKPPAVSGLTAQVSTNRAILSVGESFAAEFAVTNQGAAAIDVVNLEAQVSDHLRIVAVTPEGAGRIEGNKVIFEPIRNLAPMQLKFQIQVEAAAAGDGLGRITLTMSSASALPSGSVTREAVVRISE